ncbi:uncharacterized protein LOC119579620 [Penaeus monodon]|uniref:uncharacterized protein LOC119579620 n=1 Tax=Penaeus monodon TaxID=6687 RepID=UPI0018A7BFB0|nr:uncharacterized protein LOC119579620 [Penaeus monodon]
MSRVTVQGSSSLVLAKVLDVETGIAREESQLVSSTVDPQYKNNHNGYSQDNRVNLIDVIGLGYMTSEREGMDSQYGFRPKRSCATQLMETHHDTARLLDRRDTKQVDAMLLEFTKAIDKIPYRRLTLKLRYYGITGPILHWITAFLTCRTQQVSLGNLILIRKRKTNTAE